MPRTKTKTPSPYCLKPVDPLTPVPYPPVHITADGRPTGLICPSLNCLGRRIHTTIYTTKRNQQTHLISLKCKFDPDYYRSYYKEKFRAELVEINNQLLVAQYLPAEGLRCHLAPDEMDFSRLLNEAAGPPTPPPTQQAPGGSARPRKEPLCQGVNGEIFEGHNGRKNNGCSATACSDCCIKLNTQPCSAHNAIRKRKIKEQASSGNQDQGSIQPNSQIDTPLTQADRIGSRRLIASELRKFHAITIKKQGDERLLKQKLEAAKNIITMVVWSGEKSDWATPRVFRFHAPQWPLFALNEYEGFTQIVKERLGDGWEGLVQVYNDQLKTWVQLSLTMVESYSPTSRTILVVFPNIPPSECTGVEQYLAMSNSSTNGAMDIRAFIPPALLQLQPQTTPTTRLVSDIPHVECISDSEPDNILDTDDIMYLASINKALASSESQVSSQVSSPRASTPQKSNPSTSLSNMSTPTANRPRWPNGVLMIDMLKFLDLTGKFSSNKQAFVQIWDASIFRKATVTKWRRWMEKIEKSGSQRLKEYVESHPGASAIQAKEHFAYEWKAITAASGDQEVEVKQPVKRVKL